MVGVKQLYCYKKSWRLGGARLKIWIDHFTLPRLTRQLLSWPLDSPRIGGSPLTCPTCCWLGDEFSGRTFCGRYAWSVMLGPKKSISFYRVEGIITKVRDLKNQHLHPVATLSVLSMFIFPHEGDQRSRSRSQPSSSWEGACGGEGPLFVSSNGAQVESAPWFPFLTMYDLLINRPFPNNLFFFEKPALVSSWITLSSRSGPLFFPPLAWRKGPFH